MYGGIFTDRPFEFNIKCIIISLFLSIGYWMLPSKNLVVLMFILISSYIAISWYDNIYDCNARMKSGQYTPRSIFKPQLRNPVDVAKIPPPEYTYLRSVYLFHLIAVVPLMLYCGKEGYYGNIGLKGHERAKFAFSTLISLGLIGGLYHGFRLYKPREVTATKY